MPRNSRESIISTYLHIMVQGINKENIFQYNDFKQTYLNYMKELSQKLEVDILIYSIMDNHAHFLVHYKKIEDISKMMNITNSKYAKFYNRKQERVGYVYRERFKSKQIIDLNHLYNTVAYIHYNPVKAGIVKQLEEYPFSSYKDFVNDRIAKETINLLFDTENYKEIFSYIHKNYEEKEVLKYTEKENYEKIIEEFMKLKGFKSLKEVTKDNDNLTLLVKELREKAMLKDKEITQILKIGKNRIYETINKKGKKGRPLIPFS